ncbi:hypothetical protein Y032_0030g2172 [Ancylostoma ceylanicum]|uniref:Uncharacterized protein n=1 Tax=Ancylostoma ceylanicum TaxID=53326 RepID=A0A016UT06_9BILA|nr:hypothetical protein Y032_0030g2172 [Ancylostoma ceylanicum]
MFQVPLRVMLLGEKIGSRIREPVTKLLESAGKWGRSDRLDGFAAPNRRYTGILYSLLAPLRDARKWGGAAS